MHIGRHDSGLPQFFFLFGTKARVKVLKLVWVHSPLYLFYSLLFTISISYWNTERRDQAKSAGTSAPGLKSLTSHHLLSFCFPEAYKSVLIKSLCPPMPKSCRKATGGKTRVGAWVNFVPGHCLFLWLIHSCRNHSLGSKVPHDLTLPLNYESGF